MLILNDPFRQLDRFAEQVLGTRARPAAVPMDAWREGDEFVVALDLPGVEADSVDLDVEQNVLTVRAERKAPVSEDTEMFASERPRGVFSRQLVLGDGLDTEKIKAGYQAGVLTLRIPVSEEAKPRRIAIETTGQRQQISP